ncbi:hypothetical protein KP806_07935 [Paenibacillus sp. N4]|uniref:DUF5696 domain-containing protein n=1 Tax=Paenibacillus vietnamensis TaxID=2590547 RepID=UPI001CD0713F|nr:DUF5696 domain-containing protein [Paenibacillus vietnamensis]MCA0754978.1 hypothetical protein [Paenibacillus vietnamensis]
MNKKKILVAALSCAAAIIALGGYWFFASQRGAVNDAAVYKEESSRPEAGTELRALADASPGIPGMKLVADNPKLSLYYDPDTTEVAVLDKQSGKAWRSNPSSRGEDAIASGYEKESLSSQLTVLFRDALGTLDTFTNFGRSISDKQFAAEKIENGIRITYTLGDLSLGIDALPKLIGKSRLEEKVLSKLDQPTANYVSARYYPSEANPEVLERLDGQIAKQLVLNKMLAAFEKAGYSSDDLAADNAEHGALESDVASKPNFVIPIEYRLDDESLVATVPLAQIRESGEYRIRSIELLNFFGAAGTGEVGYMFVPDGSGSLIHLNNGKVKEEQYVQRLYGADPNDNSIRRGQVSESARMPVFGLKSGKAGWFAEIEQGSAIASIAADVSGRKNSYNHVYSTFALRGEDELELYTGSKIQEIQLLNEEMYKGDIRVRYHFLSGAKATYAGMAELYQNRLVSAGALKPLKEETALPFYLDIAGAVDKQKSFLGVPYRSVVSMTNFEQASELAAKLKKDGIDRLQMRYMGWFGNGIYHKSPIKLDVDGVLGGKNEFRALSKQLKEAGGNLYPDVAFQQVFRNDAGFAPSRDAARFVTKEQAELYPYNRALNRMDISLGSYYLLSPAKLPHFVDAFINRYASFGMSGVSLRDLGGMLSSDYRDHRVVHRESAMKIVEGQLDKLESQAGSLMIADGNAYSWPYADHLINVPTASSGFKIADEEVPFYQMVIHGFVNYAGSPVNLSDEQDMQEQLLRTIELGASPHFLWSYEPSSSLKFTAFDMLFSSSYEAWYDEALAMYKEANETLKLVSGSRMVNHIRHLDGVTEVQYENGISIIVNYTKKSVSVKGHRIGAEHYWIGGVPS